MQEKAILFVSHEFLTPYCVIRARTTESIIVAHHLRLFEGGEHKTADTTRQKLLCKRSLKASCLHFQSTFPAATRSSIIRPAWMCLQSLWNRNSSIVRQSCLRLWVTFKHIFWANYLLVGLGQKTGNFSIFFKEKTVSQFFTLFLVFVN